MVKIPNAEHHFGLTYIATGGQTNGRYFQCSASIPPGDKGPPLHFHANESEGFYVITGSLTLLAAGKEHTLTTGDFFNVMPGVVHSWFNDSNKTVELIITFSPSGIEDMFRELDEKNADFVSIGIKYGMSIVE